MSDDVTIARSTWRHYQEMSWKYHRLVSKLAMNTLADGRHACDLVRDSTAEYEQEMKGKIDAA